MAVMVVTSVARSCAPSWVRSARGGSHDPVSSVEWQGRVKRIYDAFSNGQQALEFYAVEGGRC